MDHIVIWSISLLSIAFVIIRPFKWPEAVWVLLGVLVLLLLRQIPLSDAWHGIKEGTDVYLFLIGMMLLSETARAEGLFDFLAAKATEMSKGSGKRLFLLVYLVGVLVTVFLSNDATAVVLTPAVAAAVKAAKVEKPLPYLLLCAFVANAASFVLPISNPANLVIYGDHLPGLFDWIKLFALPAIVCIASTYFVLFFIEKKNSSVDINTALPAATLSKGGKIAIVGLVATAIVITVCSAMKIQLGLPTCIVGILASTLIFVFQKKSPIAVVKGVSWSVLPLVAGLFILVVALKDTGIIDALTQILKDNFQKSPVITSWLSGLIPAYGCNIMNNLPAGLITGNVVQNPELSESVRKAALIGIDVGPNLSVTGSLATILWLTVLKREGYQCSAWDFLKIGVWVMTIPLLLSLLICFL